MTRPNKWTLLLAIPVVMALLVPLYNREDPELVGVPFFYWFQMVCIPVGVACTIIVYRKTRTDG